MCGGFGGRGGVGGSGCGWRVGVDWQSIGELRVGARDVANVFQDGLDVALGVRVGSARLGGVAFVWIGDSMKATAANGRVCGRRRLARATRKSQRSRAEALESSRSDRREVERRVAMCASTS